MPRLIDLRTVLSFCPEPRHDLITCFRQVWTRYVRLRTEDDLGTYHCHRRHGSNQLIIEARKYMSIVPCLDRDGVLYYGI